MQALVEKIQALGPASQTERLNYMLIVGQCRQ